MKTIDIHVNGVFISVSHSSVLFNYVFLMWLEAMNNCINAG